ncbi:MAG: hypothetical protein R2864_15270 [Syntrophotaleaceae bacterium]
MPCRAGPVAQRQNSVAAEGADGKKVLNENGDAVGAVGGGGGQAEKDQGRQGPQLRRLRPAR